MIDIIQIYKVHRWIEKPYYTTGNRNLMDSWNSPFSSRTGYLENQTLYLPHQQETAADLKAASLVIIQDIKDFDPFQLEKASETNWWLRIQKEYLLAENPQLLCFSRAVTRPRCELFRLRRNDQGHFEVYLEYRVNESKIGIPGREDHKIGELKPAQPIRYRINGKSDFTLSGRKQRTFSEFDYIIEYLGKASAVEFKPLNEIETNKHIPLDSCKLIDERKILQ